MTDDQQRARELLAQEYERSGLHQSARDIRTNRMDEHLGWVREANMAIAAITAALRAAPEVGDSYVVLQRVDVKRLLAGDENSPGYELSRKRVMGCLAARPQGVK